MALEQKATSDAAMAASRAMPLSPLDRDISGCLFVGEQLTGGECMACGVILTGVFFDFQR